MKSQKLNIIALSATILSIGCSKQNFEKVGVVKISDPITVVEPINEIENVSSSSFKITSNSATLTQDQFDKNTNTITFSVFQNDGYYANNLTAQDFNFSENGLPISKFVFSTNSQNIEQIVDIVLVFDITGSMAPTIEDAKGKVRDFIYQTRAQKIHTRLCLVTFGDHIINKCDKFYDNDPNDPNTMVQVNEFITKITKLEAPTGWGRDYGGTDSDENQLRALIEAANAPWSLGTQRFGILVTDAGFHYSPTNQGDSGADAPTYLETINAIQNSKMSVFVVAPKMDGYNKSFQKMPSVVDASNGLYFKYDDLVSGKINMNNILSKVVDKIKATYTITFISEENSSLDPTLPAARRNITASLKSLNNAKVEGLTFQSSYPNGHPEYKKSFKIANSKAVISSITVNDQTLTSGFHVDDSGNLNFDSTPEAGAIIKVNYLYPTIAENLKIEPILIDSVKIGDGILVYFNNILANKSDYALTYLKDSKQYQITLKNSALTENDPYKIKVFSGLDVIIKTNKLKKPE